jgi:SAM-dependent methyltransferase
MEGALLTLSGLPRRLLGALDRGAFPEAAGAGDQWLRQVMNERIDAHLASLDPTSLRAVEISGHNHAAKPWGSFTSLDFPEFDLCAELDPASAGRYDMVICEQVLEHVIDPCAAAANLRRLCAPGGHVIVSTPFLIRVHELPMYAMRDYWRFTPRGLQTLLERAGLDVESVDSWGNRQCVVGNLDRWASYRRRHSLANNPNTPVQVWAFARRPV